MAGIVLGCLLFRVQLAQQKLRIPVQVLEPAVERKTQTRARHRRVRQVVGAAVPHDRLRPGLPPRFQVEGGGVVVPGEEGLFR